MGRPVPANPILRAIDVGRIWLSISAASRRERALFAHVHTYVSFIGHMRSGHSIVGALLDAHPNAVIGSEEGALQYVNVGFDRWRIFSLLYRNTREIGHSRSHLPGKKRGGGYTYDVAGQWQGRAERIEVIGDKYGAYNSIRLGASPRLAKRLHRVVGVPPRFIHVVRNPFDNISTIARRGAEIGTTDALDLDAAINQYASLCVHTETVREFAGAEGLYSFRHEDFVAQPADELAGLCRWLGLGLPPKYLAACAEIVNPSPHASRDKVPWPDAQRRRVEALIEETPFLDGYTFEA